MNTINARAKLAVFLLIFVFVILPMARCQLG